MEERMLSGTEFSADVDRVTHCARYYVTGKKVIVISDYGEGGTSLSDETAQQVAERVLVQLVRRGAEQRAAMTRHGP
jgi:hypothetical protein